MSEGQDDVKVSYPYMTAGQWFGVRAKLRQSLPSVLDVDWLMAALGSSEKGARNLLPQLRAVGLIDADGKPQAEVAHDLRDDATYGEACRVIVERLYPAALKSAWDSPAEDPIRVAAWFMRNAGTGAATAKMQAKLYLLLLGGQLPSADEIVKKPAKKQAPRKVVPADAGDSRLDAPVDEGVNMAHKPVGANPGSGPNLHIDIQIHISADASDRQIDTIFSSMAKHLYGRG